MACPLCENTADIPVSGRETDGCIRIALAGNPNCGKTSTFNRITGANQHVGNYPGVTIEKKEGWASAGGRKVIMVDLPGTYSLTAYSLEERVTREVLAPDDPSERPQAVIDVIDSGVLERGLFLAIQIREMGLPVVLACNMMDEARSSGTIIDLKKLSTLFGVAAVPTCARTGEGLDEALNAALDAASAPCGPMVISYGSDLDAAILDMVPVIESRSILTDKYPARWTAIKLLEDDEIVREQVSARDAEAASALDAIRLKLADHIAKTEESTPEALISDYRYGYIHSLLKGGIVRKNTVKDRLALTDSLDKVLTHAVLGPVIMVAVLYLMFQVTFEVGAYPQGWVEDAFSWLGECIGGVMRDGLLKSMIVDGIIGGVGGVLSFVPLIFIMFLFVSFLEDSGYIARMAYMLDRIMRMFGLHGASVMPFIVAGGIPGGCAIPGVMATRTMRSEKERMATMLTVPLFVCGAKTPVFLMLTAAFFEESQAAVMMAMVAAGWVVSLVVAFVLRRTVIRGASTPFVMELPPYRLPTMFSVLAHTWERSWMYMKKAGTVILAISVVLWAALTFPELDPQTAAPYRGKIEKLEQQLIPLNERIAAMAKDLGIDPGSFSSGTASMPEGRLDTLEMRAAEMERSLPSASEAERASLVKRLDSAKAEIGRLSAEKALCALITQKKELEKGKQEAEDALAYEEIGNTFGGRIGHLVEPIFKPLGFDWRTDVALIAGVAAKEAILSTMGTAYSIGEADPDNPETLGSRLLSDPGWSKTVALALMLFTLIYSPCLVTLVVLKNEAGGWRWLFFSIVFNTAVAYAAAYAGTLIGRAVWGS